MSVYVSKCYNFYLQCEFAPREQVHVKMARPETFVFKEQHKPRESVKCLKKKQELFFQSLMIIQWR